MDTQADHNGLASQTDIKFSVIVDKMARYSDDYNEFSLFVTLKGKSSNDYR